MHTHTHTDGRTDGRERRGRRDLVSFDRWRPRLGAESEHGRRAADCCQGGEG